ncbi:hypothetical protein [Streptomyces sp. NPDC046161]|uniref:hypothetical protein n=1 Tax=Streptomyces sp. NPDC046161 TaxID=3155132 RepID=UPI003409E7FB
MTLTFEQARLQAAADIRARYSSISTWDAAVLDQVVEALGSTGRPFSMNDIRLIVPEDSCRNAGLYFHGLLGRDPELLRVTGEEKSINDRAHGKPVKTYVLTKAGRRFIAERRATRTTEAAGRSAAA